MNVKRAAMMILVAAMRASSADAADVSQPIGCLIEPDVVADIGSSVIGVVQSVMVERGDRISKGQVIAILRNDVERAALDVARTRARANADERSAIANYEFTRQRLARSEELFQKQFISRQALDQAIAETEVAQQRVQQAREQQSALSDELRLARARLEDRTIRSPLDGIVTERYVSAGERIEEKAIVRVARIDPLRIEVIMPGTLFGSIAAGASARILPDMPNAVPLHARVSLVDKMLDAASNTFRVRLHVANPAGAIPAGMRCKADFGDSQGKPVPSATRNMPSGSAHELKLDRGLSEERIPGAKPARSM